MKKSLASSYLLVQLNCEILCLVNLVYVFRAVAFGQKFSDIRFFKTTKRVNVPPGIIFPIISRVVFDYNNFKNMNKIRFRAWLSVVMDWTWRGDKGYPYLMTLLMMVLTVGAFQVRLCSTR